MFKRTITTRSKATTVQENKPVTILPSFKRKAEKSESEMNKRLALGDITNAKFKTKVTTADSKGAEFKKPSVLLGVTTATTKTTASVTAIPLKTSHLTTVATDRNTISAKAHTQSLQAPVPVAIGRNPQKNPVKSSSSSSLSTAVASTVTSTTTTAAAGPAAATVSAAIAAKKTTLLTNVAASKVTIPLRTTAKLNTIADKKRVVLNKIKPSEINKKTELANRVVPKAVGLKINPGKNFVTKPLPAKVTAKTNNIQGRRLTNEFQKISLSQNKNSTVFKNDGENDEKMEEDENKENQKCLAKFEPVQRLVPENVEDFDKSVMNDLYQAACYAYDIFEYLRENEIVVSDDYLLKQKEVTNKMRRLLVDWMVEIQDNFHLTHETLYLGVKIVDLYMSRNIISKDRLQILGTVALFLASKYEERNPPPVDDFVFICDGLYTKSQIYAQEMKVFKNIDFFLGYPLSYSFLRRFARCGKVSMTVLTLARYILESSLLEYQFISVSDSKVAAASLFLALMMMHENEKSSNSCFEVWTPTICYFSGYSEKQILPIALMLNNNLQKQIFMEPNFIKAKYSTELFYEVSKMKLLDNNKLEIN